MSDRGVPAVAAGDARPQRRRFYEGIYQAEIDGALWTFETIEHARCLPEDVPRDLTIIELPPARPRSGREESCCGSDTAPPGDVKSVLLAMR